MMPEPNWSNCARSYAPVACVPDAKDVAGTPGLGSSSAIGVTGVMGHPGVVESVTRPLDGLVPQVPPLLRGALCGGVDMAEHLRPVRRDPGDRRRPLPAVGVPDARDAAAAAREEPERQVLRVQRVADHVTGGVDRGGPAEIVGRRARAARAGAARRPARPE